MTMKPEEEHQRFGKIALTGGIASGKTTVCRMFADLGAGIIDADEIARRIVEPGEEGWVKLREHLAVDFFDEQGRLRRRMVREKIIKDPSVRHRINDLLHPLIEHAMDLRWRQWVSENPGRPLIFDIPLLFEAGLEDRFQVIIVVYVPRAVQIERLMKRDGLSREEAEETLSMQLPIEMKRNRADHIIDNSSTPENTGRQVEKVWKKLTG